MATSTTSLDSLTSALQALGSPEKALLAQRFFKTGKGQYGEGDIFLGLTVPETRSIARAHAALPLPDVLRLLTSQYHEERLCALYLLIRHYEAADTALRDQIYESYIQYARYVNNWDLVDASAYQLAGEHLLSRGDMLPVFSEFARSEHLWTRRIAMVGTFAATRVGELAPALAIAELLLRDTHDLMHKAVGWMLREVGKKDEAALRAFLEAHIHTMPRTALRYAIERFPEPVRKGYLLYKR